jgi:hypothetical protein
MIALPKLLLLVAAIVAVWYAVRWWQRTLPNITRRREAPSAPRQAAAIEDLVACRICGSYIAADAPGCGKPGCPQPR